MTIVTIQNKKDEKFLRRSTSIFDFKKFTKAEIQKLIKDMRMAMKKADGVGLSANQIGVNLRIFVAQVENKFYAVFNPEIVQTSDKTAEANEGCLSVPGTYGVVARPEKITLLGYNSSGKKIKIKAWGLLAKVFQHETDHLNGKLFIDKVERAGGLPVVK